MNRDGFEYEDEISFLREYLDEVAACPELSTVPLPSADLIWWRAQLEEKRRLTRRYVQAINAVTAAAIAVSIALIAVAALLWAPEGLRQFPLPVPLTVSCLLLFAGSTGGVLVAWARQR